MARHSVPMLLLAVLATAVAPAGADPLVDQECLPELWGYYSIGLGTPMGQEFVPQVGALTFVDLWVINEPASNNAAAKLVVVIRADSLGGPELGQSAEVAIPKPYDAETRFQFDSPIPLEPGRTYVVEARRSEGPGNPMLLWGDKFGSCPGVTGFWQGRAFVSGGDFWYRTGYDPVPAHARTWGGLKRELARAAGGTAPPG